MDEMKKGDNNYKTIRSSNIISSQIELEKNIVNSAGVHGCDAISVESQIEEKDEFDANHPAGKAPGRFLEYRIILDGVACLHGRGKTDTEDRLWGPESTALGQSVRIFIRWVIQQVRLLLLHIFQKMRPQKPLVQTS